MIAILRDLFGPGTWGAGGNIAAAPILAVAAALITWVTHKLGLLRRLADRLGPPVAAWWAVHHPHKDKIDRALAAAEAAQRIAADTHEHLTGERHPDSPERGGP